MLFRLGQTFERLSSFVRGTERELLPVINKTGGTVDRVNYELDKLDTVTDSAVSMADSADTAVRAVSTAITKPVEKVSGLAAGISHGFSHFRRSKDFGGAKDAARGGRATARGRPPRGSPRRGAHADGDRAPADAAEAGSAAKPDGRARSRYRCRSRIRCPSRLTTTHPPPRNRAHVRTVDVAGTSLASPGSEPGRQLTAATIA